jgi:hypothetical protein
MNEPEGFRADVARALEAALLISRTKRWAYCYAHLALAAKYHPPLTNLAIMAAIDPAMPKSFASNVHSLWSSSNFGRAAAEEIAAAIGARLTWPEEKRQAPPPFVPPKDKGFRRDGPFIIRPNALPAYYFGDPPPGRSALDRRRQQLLSKENHS